MSRHTLFVAIAIAAVIAAFLIIVPLAQDYAAQHLGWDEHGQTVFARFAFFPILLVFLGALRWLSLRRRDKPPSGD